MSDETQASTDDDRPFKVTDRRSFDSAGQPRGDVPAEAEQVPDDGTPAVEATTEAANPASTESSDPATTGAVRDERNATAAAGDTTGTVDFQQFVYFLYMSSLQEMGVPTEQGAPPAPPNLERARFFVDVLLVLKEKTTGNLDAGEDKLLEEILYNLQMQYVAASGAPSAGA